MKKKSKMGYAGGKKDIPPGMQYGGMVEKDKNKDKKMKKQPKGMKMGGKMTKKGGKVGGGI